MSRRPLTTTSFAILGLLAVQPWATYDLAKLMRRLLHFFWPRAESNLYAEPKRLVAAGLAEAREEWNGDRRRTVYSITDPPIKALRKVIPPLRLGNFALDLSFLLVLVITWVLLNLNDSLLLS